VCTCDFDFLLVDKFSFSCCVPFPHLTTAYTHVVIGASTTTIRGKDTAAKHSSVVVKHTGEIIGKCI